uniref:SET domain-containing protein n=1 Tax=Alexandrium monilatum TaxID=311494 RepID=A0A7S4VAH6_9DINO
MFEFDFEALPSAETWTPVEAPSPQKPRAPPTIALSAVPSGSTTGASTLSRPPKERAVGRQAAGAAGHQRQLGSLRPPLLVGRPGQYEAFKEPRIFTVLARVAILRQSPSMDAPWRGVRQPGELVQAVGAYGAWLCLGAMESALDGAGSDSLWLHTVTGEEGRCSAEAARLASAALLLFRGIPGGGAEDGSHPSAGHNALEEVDQSMALALYTQMVIERCSDTFAPPQGCMTVDPRRLAGAFTPTICAPGPAQLRARREQRPRGDCGLDPWRVFATSRISRGEAVETCPLLVAKTRTCQRSSALSERLVSCGGGRALQLGIGCLYRRVGSPHEANVSLGVSGSSGVAVLRAARDVHAGEELLLGKDAQPQDLDGEVWRTEGGGIGAFVPWSPRPALQAGLTAGAVRWGRSPVHERGVFAAVPFETGDVVELCPAIVLDEAASGVFDDFTMEFSDMWGQGRLQKKFSVLALGFGALYNHRDPGFNVVWGWLEGFGVVEMRAVRDIEEGEELFISYGEGYWASRGPPR